VSEDNYIQSIKLIDRLIGNMKTESNPISPDIFKFWAKWIKESLDIIDQIHEDSNETIRKGNQELAELRKFVRKRMDSIKEYCGDHENCECEDCNESCPDFVDQMDCSTSDEYNEAKRLLCIKEESEK
jgi:hypothetical protein